MNYLKYVLEPQGTVSRDGDKEFHELFKICSRTSRDCLTRWIWLLIKCMVSFRPQYRTGPFFEFLGVPMIS